MSERETLKPCKCGAGTPDGYVLGSVPAYWGVQCPTCKAVAGGETWDEARAAWNRRAGGE